MNKTYIGIDNGITGAVGIIKYTGDLTHFKMPVKKELNYTKTKAYISRINSNLLETVLYTFLVKNTCTFSLNISNTLVIIERPMVNPMRFKASVSAIRALEATLVIIEKFTLPYQYIDSKEWQRELLPKGLKKEELKKASLDVGNRLFPSLKDTFKEDADAILIAEYARRKKL